MRTGPQASRQIQGIEVADTPQHIDDILDFYRKSQVVIAILKVVEVLTPKLKLRAGAAYEISPVQDATERLVQIPDADRIWASIGGTYQFSETMAFNFGYSHVFVQDATLERNLTTGTPPTLFANTSSSVDIFSVGFSMKLGGSSGLK